MKSTGFVAEPAIDIEKTCPAASAFGDDITYDITITNNGNEDLENIVVMDTVDGHFRRRTSPTCSPTRWWQERRTRPSTCTHTTRATPTPCRTR